MLSCSLFSASSRLSFLRLSDKRFLTQVDGFYSLLLTAKRLDTEVSPDNGPDGKEAMAKRLTMAKNNDTGGKIPPISPRHRARQASMPHYGQLNAGKDGEHSSRPRIPITTVTLLSSKLTRTFFSQFLPVFSLILHLFSADNLCQISTKSPQEIKWQQYLPADKNELY